jgi:hypothetical protein
LLFRPNFCWRRGAVSSFFAFPTQLLLTALGGCAQALLASSSAHQSYPRGGFCFIGRTFL